MKQLIEAARAALHYIEEPPAKLWPAGTLHRITIDLRTALAAAEQPAEPVTPSEAVYGFAGWLTCRDDPVTMGSTHNATQAADLVQQFVESQGWPEPRSQFADRLKPYPPAQPASPVGWKPIETAPTDGREALVFRPLAHKSGDSHIAIKRLTGGNTGCWWHTVPDGHTPTNPTDGYCHTTHWMPLPAAPGEVAAAPAAQVPLTDKQIDSLRMAARVAAIDRNAGVIGGGDVVEMEWPLAFARAIERAHGIKGAT